MENKIIISNFASINIDNALNYISYVLKSEKAAQKLESLIRKRIEPLSRFPEMYTKVINLDGNETIYRRITIGNYVLLYTIDYNEKIVYISAFYYRKKQLFKISLKNSKAFRLKNHNFKN